MEITEDNSFGVLIKHRRFCRDTVVICEEVDAQSHFGELSQFGQKLNIEPQNHQIGWEGERFYMLKNYPVGDPRPLPFLKGAADKFKETYNYICQTKFFRNQEGKVNDWTNWQKTFPQTDDVQEYLLGTNHILSSPLLTWITGKLTYIIMII